MLKRYILIHFYSEIFSMSRHKQVQPARAPCMHYFNYNDTAGKPLELLVLQMSISYSYHLTLDPMVDATLVV